MPFIPFDIDNPVALLLLLVLPAIYLLGRERLALMSPWRGRSILAVRVASIAAVILALAGPSVPMNDSTMSVAFVLDHSASISPGRQTQQERWVDQAMAKMRSTDKAAVITFDDEAWVSKGLSGEKEYRQPPATRTGGDGSNLAAALKLASGTLPASGLRKIVVMSDGWDTEGGLEQSARSLPAGTRLEVVPLPAMEDREEVLIESLRMPTYLREGDGFDVSAVVASNHEGSAEVGMLIDSQPAGNWSIQLGGGTNLVTLPQQALPLGFHSIEVQLSTGRDTIEENNRAAGFVVVKEKGSVLVVEGRPESGSSLVREMEDSGLQVERVAPADFPIQMPLLLGHDAVVMADVSATSLSLDQIKSLESYVKDQGRGLVVMGGKGSFGLGDYASGPLEELLPVSSNVPLSRERADMALVLVIDRSGSMDDSRQGVSKIGMAREAALQAIQVLKPEDQIGILAFDTDPHWVVPIQKVGTDTTDLRNRITRIQASGGTDIFTALQTSYNAIREVQASQKHITLLSDGQSWKGSYEALLQRMRPLRITLSTVAIGSDADSDWLSTLARLGDGRFYLSQRFTDIPRIVYREVSVATRVSEVEGQVDPLFTTPSPILRGIKPEEMPPLTGYVATRPKEAATIVLRSSRGDPLLAQWQYGLGRVVAWTSDSEGLWTSAWASRPEFLRIWDQAARWSMAPPIDHRLRLRTEVNGSQATITAESVDHNGLFINLADTRAQIRHPDGGRETVVLRQVAPGRYQAAVQVGRPGVYRVDVTQQQEGQATTEMAGFAVAGAPEFGRLGSNDAQLKEMAATTGGRQLRDPAEAFSREGMPATPGWEPLWPYLLALSLALLPVEVALRRIRYLPFGRQAREDSQPAQRRLEASDPDQRRAA